jgi:hypothetical protein
MHDVVQLSHINLEMSCLCASEDAEAGRFNRPCWHIRILAKFKEISKCCQNFSNFSWIAAKLIHKFWSWKLKFWMFIYFLWCSENQIPWFVGLPRWKLSRHNDSVQITPYWEPQEKGMMSTAGSLPLVVKPRFIEPVGESQTSEGWCSLASRQLQTFIWRLVQGLALHQQQRGTCTQHNQVLCPNLRWGCQSHRFAVNKGLSVSSGKSNSMQECK